MFIKGLSSKSCRGAVLSIVCVISISLLPIQTLAVSVELRDARRTFERTVNKIERDFKKEHQGPLDNYEADLNKVLSFMKNKQDEFGLRPTEEELERFKTERTVPLGIVQGLPKLIQKARDRYADNVKPIKDKRKAKMNSLLDNYFKKLSSLEVNMQASADTAGLADVQKEISRVKEKFGSGTGQKVKRDDFSVITVGSALSGNYLQGLALMYVMKARSTTRMRDMSSRGVHGRLIGASINDEDPDALVFREFHEIIETEKPVPLGSPGWTIIAEVKFPLEGEGNQRILVTGAFRKNHIMVDPIGILGVGVNTFKTSSYDTSRLKGWHRIAAVTTLKNETTTFYVDGMNVGAASAVCDVPIKGIGNCLAYGRPWGGGINAVLVWNRPMAAEEIQKLPQKLLK